MRIIMIMLVVALPSLTLANQQLCTANLLKFNICEQAKQLAEEENKNLPYMIAERVQIVSFTANLNVLSQGIKLLYDRTFFEKAIIQQGRSLDEMKNQMFENSKRIACDVEVSRAFIDSGGHMRFLYEFADGEILHEFYVSVC